MGFSWMWQTPHLCLPKESHDKGAEMDFWKACKRDSFPYGVCKTNWEPEIFCNCIDAQVGEGDAPAPLAPSPFPSPMPVTPSPASLACVPIGACGGYPWCEQSKFEAWCTSKGVEGSCPSPFCKTLSPACVPIGTCGGFPWCEQSGFEEWCASEGAGGSCPSPFCELSPLSLDASLLSFTSSTPSSLRVPVGAKQHDFLRD